MRQVATFLGGCAAMRVVVWLAFPGRGSVGSRLANADGQVAAGGSASMSTTQETPTPWLGDDWRQGRDQVEHHLRGLDVAMMEIGQRFKELNFAGVDRNWPYAQYQIEKIELALKLALERRPNRARSAEPFMNETIPFVKKAVQASLKGEDAGPFDAVIERLRSDFMKCHVAENVPHFTVFMNKTRVSAVGKSDD